MARNKLIDNLIKTNRRRGEQNIRKWRLALIQAENVENPKRKMYYDLADEILLDTHFCSEMEKRIEGVLGSKFVLLNSEGEADYEASKVLQNPWMAKAIKMAMESKFLGHSLIQLGDPNKETGLITDVSLVPRRHVIPEHGLYTVREGDDKGVFYRDSLKHWKWLLEVGESNDLGIINKCAPHILFKRFAQSAWSDYLELFVSPLRIGKTESNQPEHLDRMERMLQDMSTLSYGVLADGESIEFVKDGTTNQGGQAFKSLIDHCNSEVSKVINRAVIGEATQSGSRSKEEVGERLGEGVTSSDKRWITDWINESVLPKLIQIGYSQLAGYVFQFELEDDLTEKWKITQGLLSHYDIDPEYISETFNVPVEKKKEPAPNPTKLDAKSFF